MYSNEMNQKPLVSIIILTYNNFKWLEQNLESIFKQNYPNIEIVISDDGSHNYNQESIMNNLLKKTKNIKNIKLIHHKKNLGTVKNFNNALKEATGEYIIPLSSDDLFYDKKVVNDIVNKFISSDALVVTSKRSLCNPELLTELEILPNYKDIEYLKGDQDKLFERLCLGNFISGACTSYSRIVFDNTGFFDEEYALLEDYPFYLKLSRKKIKIVFLDKVTIKYRLGGVSSAKKRNPKLEKDYMKSIEKEILPYKNRIRKKIYNYIKFNYEYEKNNGMLSFFFIAVNYKTIIIKLLNKIKIINIDPEYFLKN